MRYIRTKLGKIIDTKKYKTGIIKEIDNKQYFFMYAEYSGHIANGIEIIKQADTIEKLIVVGDLVNYDGKILEVKKELNLLLLSDGTILDECSFRFITELYTKQGKNYVLVWTKEEGVI